MLATLLQLAGIAGVVVGMILAFGAAGAIVAVGLLTLAAGVAIEDR